VKVLNLFGVSLDAFMVAGGGVLAWLGFAMLRGLPPGSAPAAAVPHANPSLTPLILFAASPGTITGWHYAFGSPREIRDSGHRAGGRGRSYDSDGDLDRIRRSPRRKWPRRLVTGAELEGEIPSYAEHDDFLVKVPALKKLLGRGGFRHRWPLTPQSQLFKFASEPRRLGLSLEVVSFGGFLKWRQPGVSGSNNP
jgi:MarC family integral membrane protein